MKRIYVVGLGLLAIFAFSATAATSAFAASKFLLNGAEISSEITAEIESNANLLLLEDMKATGTPNLLCSGWLVIDIKPGGTTGMILEVLMLNLEALLANGTAGKPGVRVECEDMKKTCSGEPSVTAVNLPWPVELVLEGATFVTLILNKSGTEEPGYATDCTVLGILVEDTCKGETGAIMTNGTENNVLAEFSETNETITKPVFCSVSKETSGLLAGVGSMTSSAGALSVSE